MKPKFIVNYREYTLFMSFVAHELKRLGSKGFIDKYKDSKLKGIKRRYIDSMIAYLCGDRTDVVEHKKVIVDPFIYKCYFLYGDKEAFYSALANAIPQFLNNGLLVENVQEAVRGNEKRRISEK